MVFLFRTDKQAFTKDDDKKLYNERVIYKRKCYNSQQEFENTKDEKYLKLISRYNNIQMIQGKISFNSIYRTTIGNQWFRYYDK